MKSTYWEEKKDVVVMMLLLLLMMMMMMMILLPLPIVSFVSLLGSDLTAAIREELEKETDELHRMLRDLRHKLMDLRASGALGGKGGVQLSASEEARQRKQELLKRLGGDSMTDEERQKALKELGLHNASPEELERMLRDQGLFNDREIIREEVEKELLLADQDDDQQVVPGYMI